MENYLLHTKKYSPGPTPIEIIKIRASHGHRINTRETGRPSATREGRVGCRARCAQVPGTRSRAGPSIPVVKHKLCGRKAPEVFQPRGGVFRESAVRSTWKFYCRRCAKTVLGVCGWAQNAKSICIYLTTKPVAIPSESFATLGSKRTVSNSTTTLRAALN